MEPEFVGVLGTYNKLIYQDLKEVDDTLVQIVELVRDGGDQQYRELDEFESSLQQAIGHTAATAADDPQVTAALEQLRSKFATHKGRVLRSLQITDMVTQLKDHCRMKMNRVQNMSNEVEQLTEKRMAFFAELVSEMRALLEDTELKLVEDRGKAVEQRTMDEGDVEFF